MEDKVSIPKGFSFFGAHAGIKKKKKDFGLIVADQVCHGAAVFTKNTFCGACIPIGRENVANGELQAVVVTSGIANVATGTTGQKNERWLMEEVAQRLGIKEENILPSSTGMIGPQLPMATLGTFLANNALTLTDDYKSFATAILTTDKQIKVRSVTVGNATILGIVKGSGMIEPNMATMLAYLLTDAKIAKKDSYALLKNAVDESFNTLSIDSDTSTSDTVGFLASNHEEVAKDAFQCALTDLCKSLAVDVMKDGEGVSKIMYVTVKNSQTLLQAKKAAKSIVNSPLVKAALFGCDPNWGRIAMALGKTEGLVFELDKLAIYYGPYLIFEQSHEKEALRQKITDYMKTNDEIEIIVDLHQGTEAFQAIGCDLTYEYVKINSAYST